MTIFLAAIKYIKQAIGMQLNFILKIKFQK